MLVVSVEAPSTLTNPTMDGCVKQNTTLLTDDRGRTPLHLAAENGLVAVIKVGLDRKRWLAKSTPRLLLIALKLIN